MKSTRTRDIIIVGIVAVVALGIGVVIGYFGRGSSKSSHPDTATWNKLIKEPDPTIRRKIKNNIDVRNFETQLNEFTKSSRLAGTSRQRETAEHVDNLWKGYGIDSDIVTYNVLLSYPRKDHTTTISILDNEGIVEHVIYAQEPPLGDDPSGDVVPPFNAYSPAKRVEGKLVYVNYAREEDFELLFNKSINVSGRIVIARYSKGFRGNKVEQAESRGAIGIILYSDPADYIGNLGAPVFPETWWLPGTGVQRGNVVTIKGDQSTPELPSTWYAHRLNSSQLDDILPKIPCQPIGYDDAKILLSTLDGEKVPDDWKGALNITYNFGPSSSRNVILDVQNMNVYRDIHNVIGVIPGSIEPDRQVLIGNHRDAWVYGASDPASGTIILMELARIFGKLYADGWRPRRSIVFCSWDAEEYGLVGSYEWVEENMKRLTSQAVAYLNIDAPVSGNYTLKVRTVPLLWELNYKTAKMVSDPHQPSKTLYDTWRERRPSSADTTVPRVDKIGSGSDHTPFIANVGVPSMYPVIFGHETEWNSTGTPLYHTRYEISQTYKMLDPNFAIAGTMTMYMGEMARSLADSVIIPMNIKDYADEVCEGVRKLEYINRIFPDQEIKLEGIVSACKNFSQAAANFHLRLDSLDRKNPLIVRIMNDKILAVERAFIHPAGLPDRPRYKHVLHSPSGMDYYGGGDFPGLEDLLYKIGNDADKWNRVKRHIAVLTYCLQSAASLLQTGDA